MKNTHRNAKSAEVTNGQEKQGRENGRSQKASF
jgi:hypothetical protein